MRSRSLCWIAVQAAVALVAASGCAVIGQLSPLASPTLTDSTYAEDQAGNYGVFVGGGGSVSRWPAAIGSTGLIRMLTPWSTARFGVMGMDNGGIGNGGAETGIRLHAPTRLTPYAGLSTDLGFSGFHSGNLYRGRNTNTPTTRVTKVAGLAAIVPEAGVSYWLTPTTRLNAGASYFVAVNQPDFLVLGISMEFLLPDGFNSSGNVSDIPRRISKNPDGSPSDESTHDYFVETDDAADGPDRIRASESSPAITDTVTAARYADPDYWANQAKPVIADPLLPLGPQSLLFNGDRSFSEAQGP